MSDATVDQTSGSPEPASPVETNTTPKVTPFSLLVGIVINPIATFKQIRDAKHSYWWVVLALTLVLVAILAFAQASAQARAMEQFFVTPDGGGKPGVVVTGPDGATSGAAVSSFQGISPVALAVPALLGGAVILLLDYLLRALVTFLMSMVIGGKATFRETFRMSAWSTIPSAVRAFLQTIAVLITGGQVAAGLSAAMSQAELFASPLVAMLLGYMDLYTLWSLLLMGIGAAIVGKMSRGKAAFTVLIYVGVSLVGILIWFAVTSAISGALGPSGGPGFRPRGAGLRRFGG